MIYLDNAATTCPKPTVVTEAVTDAMKNMSVNAGRGGYKLAQAAADMIDQCRGKLKRIAGVGSAYDTYFMPSATIALNQLIFGLPVFPYTNIYVSPFEHNAVMRPLNALCKQKGVSVRMLPFSMDGWKLDEAEMQLRFSRNKPDYIIISEVSNATGYKLPLKQLADAGHTMGARLIVDASQSIGSVQLDRDAVRADAYVFAGHKTLYGPYGIAGLLLKHDFMLEPVLFGGTGSDSLNLSSALSGPHRYEVGSQNTFAIAGLLAAINWIEEQTIAAIEARESFLISRLRETLAAYSNVRLYAPAEIVDQAGILAFCVDDYRSEDVGEILDTEFDISVRCGFQCAPNIHSFLGTVKSGGIVRASVSYFTTEADIDALSVAIGTL